MLFDVTRLTNAFVHFDGGRDVAQDERAQIPRRPWRRNPSCNRMISAATFKDRLRALLQDRTSQFALASWSARNTLSALFALGAIRA